MVAAQVDQAITRIKPQAVVHCAAAVEGKDERELHRVNVGSTANICSASLKHGVERLVYLSSIAVVNGNSDPVLTDQMPYKANSAYGRSKIAAELVVMDHREMGLKTAILRPCMIYGEGEPHALDGILGLVNRRLLMMPDIPEVDSKLHLGYVGNVAALMELALHSDKALEGTFLAADRETTTPRAFVASLYREMGKTVPPDVPRWVMNAVMTIPPVGRRVKKLFRERRYDISRARELLGYEPEVTLEEGIKRTVARWKEKHSGSRGKGHGSNS
jgi:nucleoside-diphosphate-sugar epimerase